MNRSLLLLALLSIPFTVRSEDNNKLLNPNELVTLNNVIELVNKIQHLNESYEALLSERNSYVKNNEDIVNKLKTIVDDLTTIDKSGDESGTFTVNSAGEVKEKI